MKILIDHQTFSMQRYGGISRYFANLNAGFNATPGVSSRIATLYSQNEYIDKDSLPLAGIGKSLFGDNKDKAFKWNRRYSRWMLRLSYHDVFHPTYYDPYFIKYCRKPFVVTLHDMIYELYPELFDHTAQEIIRRKKLLMDKAAAVIAISEHTKQDILHFYPELEPKIHIVHHGHIPTNADSGDKLQLPERYILYVGERWHYKNFTPFVNAIAPLLQQDPGLHLICPGGGKFSEEESTLFAKFNIDKQLTQMNVTDGQLSQLYSQAQLFAFPSKQEGFGLPVLEAFANQCPVVCSNTTALPEVAGEAAAYFDPASAHSMRTAISNVLQDGTLRGQLIQQGTQRLSQFSMEACVNNTIEVYRSVTGKE